MKSHILPEARATQVRANSSPGLSWVMSEVDRHLLALTCARGHEVGGQSMSYTKVGLGCRKPRLIISMGPASCRWPIRWHVFLIQVVSSWLHAVLYRLSG